MKLWKLVLLACLATGTVAAQQAVQAPQANTAGNENQAPVNASPQSLLVRILTPVTSQKLATNYVDVSYALVNPGISATSPNFLVQLDGRDPIATKDTQYTFTGLTPGQHAVVVELVDANGTPVTGGRSAVVFFVTPASQPQTASPPGAAMNANSNANGSTVEPTELAPASSALPLLSVIGFGVLLGGVASALRTRG